MPTLVLSANDGRRWLLMVLCWGARMTMTMAHTPTRMVLMRRDDSNEMRKARRAQRQDETPTATRASESAVCIGVTDKSNNKLDNDGEMWRGSGRNRPRQHQQGWAPTVDFGLKWPTTTRGQRRRPFSPLGKSRVRYHGIIANDG